MIIREDYPDKKESTNNELKIINAIEACIFISVTACKDTNNNGCQQKDGQNFP